MGVHFQSRISHTTDLDLHQDGRSFLRVDLVRGFCPVLDSAGHTFFNRNRVVVRDVNKSRVLFIEPKIDRKS